jgi:hypothetical protein
MQAEMMKKHLRSFCIVHRIESSREPINILPDKKFKGDVCETCNFFQIAYGEGIDEQFF